MAPKSTPWFRLYSEVLTDRKILRIRSMTGLPKCTVIGAWATLLIMANDSPERGRLLVSADNPIEVSEIINEWGISTREGQNLLAAFLALNLMHLEGDTYVVTQWNSRQFISDSDGVERTARYRANRKALGMPVAPTYDSSVIIKRDGGKCVYCGSEKNLCVDHVHPIRLGGTDDPDNLACACKQCNAGKGGRTPEQAGYTFLDQKAKARYAAYINRNDVTVTEGDRGEVSVTTPESESESDDQQQEDQENARAEISAGPEETSPDTPAIDPDFAAITAEYCRQFGDISPSAAALLSDYLDDTELARIARAHQESAAAWVLAAIQETGLNKAANPATYLRSVMADWIARQDRSRPKKPPGGNGRAGPKPRAPAARPPGGQPPAAPPKSAEEQARLKRLAERIARQKEQAG